MKFIDSSEREAAPQRSGVPEAAPLGKRTLRFLRLTNVRIFSQIVFFALFLFSIWATWTSRLGGYPVSRFLEMDPLVAVSTALSTGHVYRYLGWSIGIIILTFLFGRVFCNWICPYGTLHQLIGWLFNINPATKRIDQNRFHDSQYLKYAILVVFLVLASLGALQIGLLDPIVLMYRAFTVFFAPASDMLVDTVTNRTGIESPAIDTFKFAPGVASRIFVGSFWSGLFFLAFVALNLWKPRFFCRFLCPLGALLGSISRYSLFRINRIVDKCTDCNLCLTRCEGAADPQAQVRTSECFSCMNCLDDCPEDALQFTMVGLDKKQVVTTPDLSKRRFIFAGVSGLLALPLIKNNGLSSDENFSPAMIRPPGSVAEPEFLEKCIKCDQCINVCPTNVLQPATFNEGGFEAMWTPVMNFNIKHCQLKCNLCSEVCPTGAIRKISVAEKLGKGEYSTEGPVRLGTAFIDTNRCLPWANQIPCVVCEEVCPTSPKAIQTIDEEVKDVYGNMVVLNKPYIVPDLCIGCGICQSECPVQDQPAVYITAVGESRSQNRKLLLKFRSNS